MLSDLQNRTIPMRKPIGHQPGHQRYTSLIDEDVQHVQMSVFGVQTNQKLEDVQASFFSLMDEFCKASSAPVHKEFARYKDTDGFTNIFVVCYWHNFKVFAEWLENVTRWLKERPLASMQVGYWLESFSVPTDYRETIAFEDYLRGLSACPHTRIEPMDESGYWGAARDRIAASGYDSLDSDLRELGVADQRITKGRYVKITGISKNLCVIRSGVSWKNCDEEQLESYQKNLEPKLNAGMEYLRQNPEKTGCCSLRQVECIDSKGNLLEEAYSYGLFLSLGHLENWSEHHPSHLAIYARALAERKKYQENLQLKTFHEIYVLQDMVSFEYVNCHPNTGLLPYFSIEYQI